jgi:hypothetical protein
MQKQVSILILLNFGKGPNLKDTNDPFTAFKFAFK